MANKLVIHSQVETKQNVFVTGSIDVTTRIEGQTINARTALEQGGAGQTFVTDGLATALAIALG
ncbi:MAG: hypothetical protein ACKVJK_22750 [Methylophagaceae bacterium]|jgi:hypothetical protein|tara:strand:+ start:901 stop:1092 length:192 start_codon:yes stop_codon:yes gene_type:complete